MEDLRMHRGVTSVRYQTRDESPMIVNYKPGDNNRLIFDAEGGILEEEFGNNKIKIIADCNENYPSCVKFETPDGKGTEAFVKFDSDGAPTEVIYNMEDGEVITSKFKTIAGFMLLTSQQSSESSSKKEYTYNDKGYMITRKASNEFRYSYEYDSKGNWTKRTCEYLDGN